MNESAKYIVIEWSEYEGAGVVECATDGDLIDALAAARKHGGDFDVYEVVRKIDPREMDMG